MSITAYRDVIYLCADPVWPEYLTELDGVKWIHANNPERLKQILKSRHGEVLVIVRANNLTQKVVEAFMSWMKVKTKLSFIFIAQTIDNAVFQLTLNNPQALVVRESDGSTITSMVTRCLQGLNLKSRRQERQAVEAPVMLKKFSADPQSPTGVGVQFLREGGMKDFSQGGALIEINDGTVSAKDFLSLMYRDQNGKWVSIESQVRWVSLSPSGYQIIGVQFLATA
ncbi:MAG: PilZ domain-containing protein [Bdellovibrio sp.]|nr:PilZ domain-containing protein [Bdellovibrio sp.]